MPLRHGSKIYCQLLLDANRYKVAEELAASEGKKVTALLREYVYDALLEKVPAEYKAAEEADQQGWQQSVENRVEGRRRARDERTIQAIDDLIQDVLKES